MNSVFGGWIVFFTIRSNYRPLLLFFIIVLESFLVSLNFINQRSKTEYWCRISHTPRMLNRDTPLPMAWLRKRIRSGWCTAYPFPDNHRRQKLESISNASSQVQRGKHHSSVRGIIDKRHPVSAKNLPPNKANPTAQYRKTESYCTTVIFEKKCLSVRVNLFIYLFHKTAVSAE